MHSTGYDTIRFYKNYGRDVTRELILDHVNPRFRDGKKENHWFHGALIGRTGDSNTSFWIEMSFAREGSSNDSNLELATPEIIEAAIRKFEDRSGIQIRDAAVSRVDMATTFHTLHPVRSYLPLLQPGWQYELHQEDYGYYLNSTETTATMYDKGKEMEVKGKKPGGEWSTGPFARIEFRCKHKVRKHLKLPREIAFVTVDDLTTNNIFCAAIRMLEENTTRLLRLGNLKSAKKIDATPADIEKVITQRLKAVDQDQYRQIRDDALRLSNLSVVQQEKLIKRSEWELMLPYRQEVHRAMRSACAQMYERYPIAMAATNDVQEMRARLAKAA